MTWQQRLQPASFRGVSFHIDTASGQGGRRVAVHQYLNQSQHWAEDMGQTAATERLQMFVIGADYDLQREKLFAALNSPGAGKLIHPYLGSMYIQVKDFSWTISTRKGGYCQIDLNYVRAGKRQYPVAKLTSKHQLEQSCDSGKAAIMKDFEAVFKLQRQAQFVQDAATRQLNRLTTAVRTAGEQVQAVVQAAGNTVQTAAEFAQTPAHILKALDDQLDQAFRTTSNIDDLFSQYQQFSSGLTAVTAVNKTDTPSRQQLAVNQNVLNQSTMALTCIRMARNISQLSAPFSTYSQAIAVRDVLLSQLDTVIEQSSDAAYGPLSELQTALIRHIETVAPGLQQIRSIELQQAEPALVTAHRLYGDIRRTADLISRNNISHPGFMPAGHSLEVLL